MDELTINPCFCCQGRSLRISEGVGSSPAEQLQSSVPALKRGHLQNVIAVLQRDMSLFTASEDHTVMHWLLHTGDCCSILRGHNGSVTALANLDSRPESPLLSASEDGTVRIWIASPFQYSHSVQKDLVGALEQEPDRTFELAPGLPLTGVACVNNGKLVCTSTQEGISLWRYPQSMSNKLTPLRLLGWEGDLPVCGPLHLDRAFIWAYSGPQALAWRLPGSSMFGEGESNGSHGLKGMMVKTCEQVYRACSEKVVQDGPAFDLQHENLLSAVLPGGETLKFRFFAATEDGRVHVWLPGEFKTAIAVLEGHQMSVTAMAVTSSVSPIMSRSSAPISPTESRRNHNQPIEFFTASLDASVMIWHVPDGDKPCHGETWISHRAIFTMYPCLCMTLARVPTLDVVTGKERTLQTQEADQFMVMCALSCPNLPVVEAYHASTRELLHEFRRCRLRELLTPQILFFVSFYQFMMFAVHLFFPWKTEMAEPVYPSYLLVGTSLDAWARKYFPPPPKHFTLTLTVTLIMVALIVAVTGIHEWLQQHLEFLESQKHQDSLQQAEATTEVRNRAGKVAKLGKGACSNVYYCGRRFGIGQIKGSDGTCGPNNGPQCPDCKGLRAQIGVKLRLRILFFDFALHFLHLIMPILTSMLVVPFVKIMLFYLVCFAEEGMSGMYLSEESSCLYEYHPWASVGIAVVLIAYLWIVVPFSVVQGDVRYVQRHELFSVSSWKDNCTLKAGVLNLGHLTLRKTHAFRLQISLLVLKWGLSLCEFLLRPSVMACAIGHLMLVLVCSAFILTADAYVFQPTNIVLRGLVLCVDWAFLIGLLCAAADRPGDMHPFVLMGVGLVFIFMYVALTMRSHHVKRRMGGDGKGKYEELQSPWPLQSSPVSL